MKKSYTTPQLTIHGTVASLTKALLRGSGDLLGGFCLRCASLVSKVPVCRLKRPRSLTGLPALAKLMEEDVGRTIV